MNKTDNVTDHKSALASAVDHAGFAPACIAGALLLALIGWSLATETWKTKYVSVGGQNVEATPQLKAVTELLKSEVTTQRQSSVSVVISESVETRISARLSADEPLQMDDFKLDENEVLGDTAVRVTVGHHFGFWAIVPAIITLAFCLVFREPLPALLIGIFSAALIMGRFNLTDDVLLPGLASTSAAKIVLLYLWLLGGLLGIWAKTGAALAFADWACKNFVRGPRSAKFVAWILGVVFFQGGTISTVLVGTTVRPVTERNKISPEELSYIVDSTASPIASLIAFNAWPTYVQALIIVPGIAYLATEQDRIAFFFKCAPLSFYSIFAILGTLLL